MVGTYTTQMLLSRMHVRCLFQRLCRAPSQTTRLYPTTQIALRRHRPPLQAPLRL